MPIGLIIVGVIVLLIAYLVVQAKRAGPPRLPDADLARATVIASATADAPGHGWSNLGSKTSADGLELRFDHDDDPVVGKQVKLLMHVEGNGTPFGGGVENDDDTDAAVGGWIEFESVEVLKVRP